MSAKNTGTWDILKKDDRSLLFLILNSNESLEILLRDQDNLFIELFLSPGSKHTYFTTERIEGKDLDVTLFSNGECEVETL